MEFLDTVSTALNIPYKEYRNIKSFILKSVDDIPEKNRVMIIDNKIECEKEGVKHLFKENLRDNIFLLYLGSTNTYILRYSGKEDLFLNGQNIFPDQSYTQYIPALLSKYQYLYFKIFRKRRSLFEWSEYLPRSELYF